VNAERKEARAAVAIAVTCSMVCRHSACSLAASWAASAAARYAIADISIPSASAALPGLAAAYIVLPPPLGMLADRRTYSFPLVTRPDPNSRFLV
jgi:hypothetical protein